MIAVLRVTVLLLVLVGCAHEPGYGGDDRMLRRDVPSDQGEPTLRMAERVLHVDHEQGGLVQVE